MKKYAHKELRAAYRIGLDRGRAQAFREALRMLAKVVRVEKKSGLSRQREAWPDAPRRKR